MNNTIHKILIEKDEWGEWEAPKTFDYNKAIQKVISIKPEIKKIIGRELQIDDSVQDASFFTELFELTEDAIGENGAIFLRYKIGIRFSSFANFVTIHSVFGNEYLKTILLKE